ncbi:hypothetical protein [Nocardiopsis suaedae]|uniref:Uncharacterized protein n=1 Tax=Nocardiopsis suaedae TaxID=3018444 RepID=A0ABT4TK70_9ACTN|nr:hypothetical protein [Nocardiopsis suaedae]MDA2805078.1 hypothetical protein [Nocardiopsis suaedae]
MALFGFGARGDRPSVPSWSIAFRAPDTQIEFEARLPSKNEGLWFEARFSLEVAWNGAGASARARMLAEFQRRIIGAASESSVGFSLGDKGAAEAELGCALFDEEVFDRAEVRDHKVLVSLTVDEGDMSLAKELELLGPRKEIQAAVHRGRMERVRELQRDVLVDSVLARVWWFEQHPDRLGQISEMGEMLDEMLTPPEQVGGIVNGDGDGGRESTMDAFLAGLEEWERPAMVDRLASILEGFERADLAERLRRQWVTTAGTEAGA